MKVRTNLTPDELSTVSRGLDVLAKAQLKEFVPDNPAEKELIRQVSSVLNTAVNNLQEEFVRILEDETTY